MSNAKDFFFIHGCFLLNSLTSPDEATLLQMINSAFAVGHSKSSSSRLTVRLEPDDLHLTTTCQISQEYRTDLAKTVLSQWPK